MPRLPKLRDDLVVSKHRQDDQTIFVVKDPLTNRFFRFVAFQYHVALSLDGRTPLESIRSALAERFNRPIRRESVEAFVQRLSTSGLLESPVSLRREAPSAPKQKSLLYYKIPFVNPGLFFDRLYRRVSFCFTLWFVIFSLAWIALAGVVVLADWEECVRQFWALLPVHASLLVKIYVILLFVVTLHEVSHGLSVHHFGGAVREAGMLFMYAQLAFYTDVSDSYLFPRKRSRTIVMLAGVYSGAFIAATAALVWRVTDPFTSLNHLSFLVMCVAGTSLIFNFNPLIKLDGYYILSDWIDIPNLRRKAFTYLKTRLQAIPGFISSPRPPRQPRRERFAYVVYGVTASIYSAALILIFVWLVKDFVIEYSPELGLIGFVVGTVTMMNRTSKGTGGEVAQQPDTRKKRRLPWRAWAWLGISGLAILGSIFMQLDLRVSSPFRLRPVDRAVVRAKVEGQLDVIFVEEGDTVRTGQPLARLATRDIDARLRNVRARIAQARAELALLRHGTRPEEIDHARAELHQAQAGLEAAQKRFDRASALAEREVIAPEGLDAARTDLALEQAAVEQARSRLALLKAGSRPEEIDAKLAEIQGLVATVEYLTEQRRLCTITSPMTGIVTTRYLKEHRNEHVGIGDPVCELIDHRTMLVEMAVPEREVGDVRIGFPVKLKAQGYPSLRFSGKVTAMAPVTTRDGDGRSVVLVESRLSNGAGVLKPGMSGIARIYCGPRPVGALALRRIVRYVRTEFWW